MNTAITVFCIEAGMYVIVAVALRQTSMWAPASVGE